MKKFLIGIAVLLFIVIAGLALFIQFGTEPTIKYALETEGSAMTESKVAVKGVNLSLLGGSLSLTGITLDNPKGFTAPRALSMGEVSVNIDRNSLMSDEIIINQILLDKPSITFERGQGSSNLEIIKQTLDKYIPQTEETAEPTKTVLIKELLINGAELTYNMKPGGKLRTLTMPDAKVQNISSGEGGEGVSYQVAIDQIVAQYTPVVIEQLVKAEGLDAVKGIVKDPGQLKDVLKDDLLKDGGGDVKEKIKGLKDLIK
jgi:uncharacterized protein involved in outer membrane biogenesis